MLLVLGMHRSGTSVTARLIECLGAVNSEKTIGGDANNPKGYFEDVDINTFNDYSLFNKLGASWHNIAPVDWSNLSTSVRSKLALEALEIIRRNYSLENPLSVLKEPRISILLPFWLSVIRHAGYNPKIVCAVRDPASVARSLVKAHGITITQAGMLYVINWISILSCIQELPVAFVHFDDVFSNPSKVLRGVASKLGIPVPVDFDARIHAFSSSFFDASLRHSTLDRRDLPLEADLPPMAIELYDTLLAAAQSQSIKKTSKFVTSAEDTISKIKPVLADYDRYFGQLGSERQKYVNLEGHAAQLNAQLEALKRAPAEATLLLEKEALRRGQLAERVTALEGTKQQQASELEVLRQQQQAAESQIATLTSERDNLAAERSTLDARLSTLVAERDELATRQQSLATERDALVAQNTTLAGERGQLAERVTALEGTKQQQASELEVLRQQQQAAEGQIATLTSERDNLAAERSTLDARLSTLVAERDELATRQQSLATESAALSLSVDDRFNELAQISKALIAAQDNLEAQQTESHSLQNQLAETRGKFAKRLTALEGAKQQLTAEIEALRQQQQAAEAQMSNLTTERNALSADLSQRFEEIALLGKRLLEVEAEGDRRVAEIQTRLDAIVARWTWKLGAPGRFVWDKTHNTAVKITRLPVALQIILKHRHSGFFNHEWYFEQNQDVKSVTSRPFLHFAFHGVFEGRAPNPSYDESKYLQSNPSLKSHGKKPLLHYTLYEGKENEAKPL
jgi:hypothetical protein